MINPENFKIYKYEDIKKLLPKDNYFDSLYEKAMIRNKKYGNDKICVYEGNIETEILDIYSNIATACADKFGDGRFYPSIILGNVDCSVLDFFEGIIIGNVTTKNMWVSLDSEPRHFRQIHGNLTVSELLFATGKGLRGDSDFFIKGNVSINTFVNYHQVLIKSNELTIKNQFDFPQIYETEDKSKHAPTNTDWSKYTLNKLLEHFNEEQIDPQEYNNYLVDFFFGGAHKISSQYNNYLLNI